MGQFILELEHAFQRYHQSQSGRRRSREEEEDEVNNRIIPRRCHSSTSLIQPTCTFDSTDILVGEDGGGGGTTTTTAEESTKQHREHQQQQQQQRWLEFHFLDCTIQENDIHALVDRLQREFGTEHSMNTTMTLPPIHVAVPGCQFESSAALEALLSFLVSAASSAENGPRRMVLSWNFSATLFQSHEIRALIQASQSCLESLHVTIPHDDDDDDENDSENNRSSSFAELLQELCPPSKQQTGNNEEANETTEQEEKSSTPPLAEEDSKKGAQLSLDHDEEGKTSPNESSNDSLSTTHPSTSFYPCLKQLKFDARYPLTRAVTENGDSETGGQQRRRSSSGNCVVSLERMRELSEFMSHFQASSSLQSFSLTSFELKSPEMEQGLQYLKQGLQAIQHSLQKVQIQLCIPDNTTNAVTKSVFQFWSFLLTELPQLQSLKWSLVPSPSSLVLSSPSSSPTNGSNSRSPPKTKFLAGATSAQLQELLRAMQRCTARLRLELYHVGMTKAILLQFLNLLSTTTSQSSNFHFMVQDQNYITSIEIPQRLIQLLPQAQNCSGLSIIDTHPPQGDSSSSSWWMIATTTSSSAAARKWWDESLQRSMVNALQQNTRIQHYQFRWAEHHNFSPEHQQDITAILRRNMDLARVRRFIQHPNSAAVPGLWAHLLAQVGGFRNHNSETKQQNTTLPLSKDDKQQEQNPFSATTTASTEEEEKKEAPSPSEEEEKQDNTVPSSPKPSLAIYVALRDGLRHYLTPPDTATTTTPSFSARKGSMKEEPANDAVSPVKAVVVDDEITPLVTTTMNSDDNDALAAVIPTQDEEEEEDTGKETSSDTNNDADRDVPMVPNQRGRRGKLVERMIQLLSESSNHSNDSSAEFEWEEKPFHPLIQDKRPSRQQEEGDHRQETEQECGQEEGEIVEFAEEEEYVEEEVEYVEEYEECIEEEIVEEDPQEIVPSENESLVVKSHEHGFDPDVQDLEDEDDNDDNDGDEQWNWQMSYSGAQKGAFPSQDVLPEVPQFYLDSLLGLRKKTMEDDSEHAEQEMVYPIQIATSDNNNAKLDSPSRLEPVNDPSHFDEEEESNTKVMILRRGDLEHAVQKLQAGVFDNKNNRNNEKENLEDQDADTHRQRSPIADRIPADAFLGQIRSEETTQKIIMESDSSDGSGWETSSYSGSDDDGEEERDWDNAVILSNPLTHTGDGTIRSDRSEASDSMPGLMPYAVVPSTTSDHDVPLVPTDLSLNKDGERTHSTKKQRHRSSSRKSKKVSASGDNDVKKKFRKSKTSQRDKSEESGKGNDGDDDEPVRSVSKEKKKSKSSHRGSSKRRKSKTTTKDGSDEEAKKKIKKKHSKSKTRVGDENTKTIILEEPHDFPVHVETKRMSVASDVSTLEYAEEARRVSNVNKTKKYRNGDVPTTESAAPLPDSPRGRQPRRSDDASQAFLANNRISTFPSEGSGFTPISQTSLNAHIIKDHNDKSLLVSSEHGGTMKTSKRETHKRRSSSPRKEKQRGNNRSASSNPRVQINPEPVNSKGDEYVTVPNKKKKDKVKRSSTSKTKSNSKGKKTKEHRSSSNAVQGIGASEDSPPKSKQPTVLPILGEYKIVDDNPSTSQKIYCKAVSTESKDEQQVPVTSNKKSGSNKKEQVSGTKDEKKKHKTVDKKPKDQSTYDFDEKPDGIRVESTSKSTEGNIDKTTHSNGVKLIKDKNARSGKGSTVETKKKKKKVVIQEEPTIDGPSNLETGSTSKSRTEKKKSSFSMDLTESHTSLRTEITVESESDFGLEEVYHVKETNIPIMKTVNGKEHEKSRRRNNATKKIKSSKKESAGNTAFTESHGSSRTETTIESDSEITPEEILEIKEENIPGIQTANKERTVKISNSKKTGVKPKARKKQSSSGGNDMEESHTSLRTETTVEESQSEIGLEESFEVKEANIAGVQQVNKGKMERGTNKKKPYMARKGRSRVSTKASDLAESHTSLRTETTVEESESEVGTEQVYEIKEAYLPDIQEQGNNETRDKTKLGKVIKSVKKIPKASADKTNRSKEMGRKSSKNSHKTKTIPKLRKEKLAKEQKEKAQIGLVESGEFNYSKKDFEQSNNMELFHGEEFGSDEFNESMGSSLLSKSSKNQTTKKKRGMLSWF